MKYYCVTDIGLKREINQDSYCALKNDNGDLLALVCDGIGGGKAGDVASGETIKYFINDFSKKDGFSNEEEAEKYLLDCIDKCNKEIYQLSKKYKEYNGMGTTITGILKCNYGTYCINVGDSRVYGYIDNKEIRLTVDNTLVNEMLLKGEITYEESLVHPKRHYLVKAVGILEDIEADVHMVQDLDYYLICSDGLYNCVDDNKISSIMCDENLDAEQKANTLLQAALLNGGYDNITIIVVDCIHE